jgi:hypothetical protein
VTAAPFEIPLIRAQADVFVARDGHHGRQFCRSPPSGLHRFFAGVRNTDKFV